MQKSYTYTVSIYNNSPINTVLYKGASRYRADTIAHQATKDNQHGVVIEHTITENKPYNYRKESHEIIKTF